MTWLRSVGGRRRLDGGWPSGRRTIKRYADSRLSELAPGHPGVARVGGESRVSGVEGGRATGQPHQGVTGCAVREAARSRTGLRGGFCVWPAPCV